MNNDKIIIIVNKQKLWFSFKEWLHLYNIENKFKLITMENSVEKNQNVEQLVDERMSSSSNNALSIGEQRIGQGFAFEKGNNNDAQNLKEHFAHIMNIVSKSSNDNNGRLVAETLTLLETASMFGIKALFTK